METNTAIHSEAYKGYTIEIFHDEYQAHPDEWKNEDAFVVYDHRSFCVERKGYNPREIFDHVNEVKRFFYEGYFVLPLYAYIHSGVSLSLGRGQYPFNDRWDVSSTGFVLVKRTKGQYSTQQVKRVAKAIVSEWNDYLSGNCYGYEILDKDGKFVDSVWGFSVDYKTNALSEAKGFVDGLQK